MATSTEVKDRYNKKAYSQWNIRLRNDDFDKIEEIREATELSRSEFLKMLVSERYDIKF